MSAPWKMLVMGVASRKLSRVLANCERSVTTKGEPGSEAL